MIIDLILTRPWSSVRHICFTTFDSINLAYLCWQFCLFTLRCSCQQLSLNRVNSSNSSGPSLKVETGNHILSQIRISCQLARKAECASFFKLKWSRPRKLLRSNGFLCPPLVVAVHAGSNLPWALLTSRAPRASARVLLSWAELKAHPYRAKHGKTMDIHI